MSHTREELEELFHELDVNGDGKLDICELENVLQGPKFNFDEAKAHEISLVSGLQFIFALNKVIFFIPSSTTQDMYKYFFIDSQMSVDQWEA